MSRKMTPFVFFITVLAILALACGGGGDVTCVPGDTICEQAKLRDQGAQVIDNVLFTNTNAEQTIQQFFCEPGNISNPECK